MNYKKIIILAGVGIVLGGIIFYSVPRNDGPLETDTSSQPQVAGILQTMTNNEGEVQVDVTPKNIFPNAASWDFEVSLNTHTVDLSEDMVEVSVLTDDEGKTYKPVAWEGDGPSGHHRSGVLKFEPILPMPGSMDLILNIAGIERSFLLELK